MKFAFMKTIKFFVAIATAFALVACSEKEPATNVGEGELISVVVSAGLPNSLGTKAYGTGANAQYLTYGIYDEDMALVVEGERYLAFEDGSLSAYFTVDLIKNQNYTLVFWADGGEDPYYSVDLSAGTVSVN